MDRCEADWENLLSEALSDVFSRLPFEERLTTVPLVCKAWRDASHEPACWRNVDMEAWFEKKAEEEYCWEFECEPKIDFLIQKVAERSCGQIRELRTMHCSDTAIEHLAKNSTSLKVLSIANSLQVTDAAAVKLALNCPKLENLNVSDCYNMSSVSLEAFGQNCKSLVYLARNMLYRHVVDTVDTILCADDEEAIAVAKKMVNLEHLEMKRTRVTDVGLWHLARGCRKLESLNLAACTSTSPMALASFSEFCPNLRHFTKPIVPRLHVNSKHNPGLLLSGVF